METSRGEVLQAEEKASAKAVWRSMPGTFKEQQEANVAGIVGTCGKGAGDEVREVRKG